MPSAGTTDLTGDLDLIREWREPVWPGRFLRASTLSILAHVAVVLLVLSLPASNVPVMPAASPDFRKAVQLVSPKFYEPTQKAPNVGKITRELDVNSALPTPRVRARAPEFRPPAPPPQPQVQASFTPPVIQPPKIELPAGPPPPPITGTVPQATPPPAPEQPKLAFENIAPARTTPVPNSQIPQPKASVSDAVRSVILPGANNTVEDTSDAFRKTQMQLLSDPKGVDFKPYLIQVLTAVRRNWMAVIPESARMGRRGSVLIQFIIDRRGAVPKLVIAEASGTEAFDRAAVAGISASYPFPPLPADYKGDQIRLQLAFTYNTPTR